eukprot:2724750-Heterocapsa_arctica.AAC.1
MTKTSRRANLHKSLKPNTPSSRHLYMSILVDRGLGIWDILHKHEDNTQCIAAVKKAYSAAIRHLHCTERIALGVAHEQFFGDNCNFKLKYLESECQKGDVFTKKLKLAPFEIAVTKLLMMRGL